MIIIPEIETVVILVPRTGSGSLKRAIAERYPDAMQIYRHMEADGVPHGYDRWKRVGVLRHPLDRLWSLHQFCQPGRLGGTYGQYPEAWQRVTRTANRPFEEWLLENELAFTNPYCSGGSPKFYPQYNVLHSVPENRKSQFLYLRPDLGTTVFLFEHLHLLARKLDVQLSHHNATGTPCPPMTSLSAAARDHIERFFAWDLAEWDFGYHGAALA